MEPLTERSGRVVAAAKLHRTAARRKAERFLVEGTNSIESAIPAGLVVELFVTTDAAEKYQSLVSAASACGAPVTIVTERAAAALSDTVTPVGMVAVCRTVDVDLADILDRKPSLVAMPVEAGEPGNAGTIIRVADAAGADGVVFAGDSVDPHNGKVVRSAAGSLFHLPVCRERSITDAIAAARASGLQILATAASGEVGLADAGPLLERPTVWLFGNEAHGLSDEVTALADARVSIPIYGRAESLNLAVSAGICLYASALAQHRK
ncbi:TrmH family RNA methyltransferase [Smaragdicoccus niigatensis]|uniref:TrmH family RNA methyltransferase n=1 Tax=Smaragdicoccus niigatensis TaxID=359359 RepID=UPI000476E9AF|nr:RNA methyltransferase [Smaragdicoccus niigatensis]